MTPKQATNFILDMVSELESEKKSGSYISNCVKGVKGWLDFNGKHIQQKIKISNRDDLVRFGDERPPTQDELRKIFNAPFPHPLRGSLPTFRGGVRKQYDICHELP